MRHVPSAAPPPDISRYGKNLKPAHSGKTGGSHLEWIGGKGNRARRKEDH